MGATEVSSLRPSVSFRCLISRVPERDSRFAGAHTKVLPVVNATSDVGILPVEAIHRIAVVVVQTFAVHIAEVIFTPFFAGAVQYPELFLPLLDLPFYLLLALLFYLLLDFADCLQLALPFPLFFMSCRCPSRRPH